MAIATFEQELGEVKTAFARTRDALHPLAIGLLPDQDFFLSRLLLTVSRFGSGPDRQALTATAQALELLDLSLSLSQKTHVSGDCSHIELIVADHLFAQALDRVVRLDRPAIINILATAIAETAVGRARAAGAPPRARLIVAAVKLGILLSDCQPSVVAALKSVAAMGDGDMSDPVAAWRELPAGPNLANLRRLLTTVAVENQIP